MQRLIVSRLREQSQTLPAHPAEKSDYEAWARNFLQLLVSRRKIDPPHTDASVGHLRRLSKVEEDETVDQMVKDATKVVEDVADESWVPWAGRIIPNVVHRVRQETEARA